MSGGGRIYRVALYLRLSREDGTGEESGSIGGQRTLLHYFLQNRSDLTLQTEVVDDGYSGAIFERPGFLRLMELIHAGKIDCILVKDLSRFGRNYIETGRYLEQIFPLLGVRFIAVNDGYDSVERPDTMLLPFQNLINDAYCRDISRKVRTQLEVKRMRGAFTGAFAPYGYRRARQNREQLEPEPRAARTVREIFCKTLEGYSRTGVAALLNKKGVLPPAQHRSAIGQAYYTPFSKVGASGWSAVAVGRILQNAVYLGWMQQGKTVRPDFRSAKRDALPETAWSSVENCHPPLVSQAEFAAVARLLGRDTRTSPGEAKKHLLSGMLLCASCGRIMVRKTVPVGEYLYVYYVCAEPKSRCTGARIRETHALESVDRLLGRLVDVVWRPRGERAVLPQELGQLEEQLVRAIAQLEELKKDHATGLLADEDFAALQEQYAGRCVQWSCAIQAAQAQELAPKTEEVALEYAQCARLLAVLLKRIEVDQEGRLIVSIAASPYCKQEEHDGAQEQKIHKQPAARRMRVCRGFGKAG